MGLMQHTQKPLLDHGEPLGIIGIWDLWVLYKMFALETKEKGGDGTLVVLHTCVPFLFIPRKCKTHLVLSGSSTVSFQKISRHC